MNALTVLWIVLALVVVGVAVYGVVGRSARRTTRRAADHASAMRARNLMGRAVVAISDAGKVGAVDDVLLDATARDVVAFRVRGGTFSRGAALLRDQVAAVGRDAIMVPAPTALNDFKRLPALDDAPKLRKLRGTRVVTEGGELRGTVSDLEIDGEARHVLSYVLRGSVTQRLRHREPTIPVSLVTHRGDRGLMVVAEDPASAVHGE
jgi:sporulation protein YlmC with PRC-barrel domain